MIPLGGEFFSNIFGKLQKFIADEIRKTTGKNESFRNNSNKQ